MYRKLLLSTLIQQEKRAAKVFLVLFLTVVFISDILNIFIIQQGKNIEALVGYGAVILALPVLIYFIRNENPRYIKYIVFTLYMVSNLIAEIIFYWREDALYAGGNIVEMYFILFSPIFINRRFLYTVILTTVGKYVVMAVILASTTPLYPISILFVLSLVVLIILNRFIGYLNAMNKSYYDQFEGVVRGIISTLELKDPYTKGHSQRVAEYAVVLARSINIYSDDDLKMIYQACLLHDIGKVHTPDMILSKPDKLTAEEYEIVKQHPVLGAQAIKDIQGYELCLDIVLYHHERWDGKGYPEGLRETQIPLTARITAIADAFDAMTSKRSYRDAMTPEQAYQQMITGKGTQFDPALITYFETVFEDWKNILSRMNGDANQAKENQLIFERG